MLRTDNGRDWRTRAVLAEEGVDLRDPKLSVAPDGRLMVLMGGSVYRGSRRIAMTPRAAFLRFDAEAAEPVTLARVVIDPEVATDHDWLWRVTWRQGIGFGVLYQPAGEETVTRLVASGDGISWRLVSTIGLRGKPNETTLRFLGDGRLAALVRREGADRTGRVGIAAPPYSDWTWSELPVRLGGPNFVVVADPVSGAEVLLAATREYGAETRTVIGRVGLDGTFRKLATLPSGGDTGYAGLVVDGEELLVSYYSSHEEKTAVYLARLRLPALLAAAEPLEERMAALALPLIDRKEALGLVIGVLADDRTIVRGFGRVTDNDDGAPDGRTVYEIGSITKAFTGLLLADAVEDGLLRVDDPIGKLLPAGTELPGTSRPCCSGTWSRTPPGCRGCPPTCPCRGPAIRTPTTTRPSSWPTSRTTCSSELPGRSSPTATSASACSATSSAARAGRPPTRSCSSSASAGRSASRTRVSLPAPPCGRALRMRPVRSIGLRKGGTSTRWRAAERSALPSTTCSASRARRSTRTRRRSPPRSAAPTSGVHTFRGGAGGVAYGWHVWADGETRWHNGQTGGFHAYLAFNARRRVAVAVLSSSLSAEIDALGVDLLKRLLR